MLNVYVRIEFTQNSLSSESVSNVSLDIWHITQNQVFVSKMLDILASLNGYAIIFTIGLIPLEKLWTPYLSIYGLNSTTAVFLQGWFGIEQPTMVDVPLNKETKHKTLLKINSPGNEGYLISFFKESIWHFNFHKHLVNTLYTYIYICVCVCVCV